VEGLPPVVRGKVWFYAYGNRSAVSKELYTIMTTKGEKLRALLKSLSQLDQEIVDNGGQPKRFIEQPLQDKENEA